MPKDDQRRATPRTAGNNVQNASRGPKGAPAFGQSSGKNGILSADGARMRRKGGMSAGQLVGLLGRLAAAAVALAIVGVLALSVMRMLPVFIIASIDTEATEHLTQEDIANLANVAEGTTLLNVDADAIEENLKKNPWVAEVHVHREFPDRIRIEVRERRISTLVLMSASSFAWYIGEGNVWLEPATLTIAEDQTAKDAAAALAAEKGALFVTDVPATVSPQAGYEVVDEVLLAVNTYVRELPEEIISQVVYFSASSLEGISCVLSSGIEVSLGTPTQIEQKAIVLMQILDQYPGEITYVNVRTPANPSYRRIDSSSVQPGTGA